MVSGFIFPNDIGAFALRILIVVLVVGDCFSSARGQTVPELSPQWMTRRLWRMQDGLPDHAITAIAETPDHSLWLGTPRNLVRFDGFHFEDVSATIAPAIHDFGVTCLFTARDGSLWIATGEGEILRVHEGAVKIYDAKTGLGSFNVLAIQQDADGAIWAGTDHGIYRLLKGRFERFHHIGDPSVHAIIPDGAGGLWLGGHHLIHFTGAQFQLVTLPIQHVPMRIEALARTPDGVMWIGTLGGLLRMDPKGTIAARPFVTQAIKALLFDREQRLWVGTLDGGLFLRGRGDRFGHLADATDQLSSTVLALFDDDSNDLWLGSESGLVRLSDSGMRLIAIPQTRRVEHATVARDTDGSLWIGAGQVLHVVRGAILTPRIPMVGRFPARSIFRDTEGALWIATAGGGAIRVPRSGTPARYGAQLGTSYIIGFLQGENGDVWIATESGIALWRNGDVMSFQQTPGAPHRAVISLANAADGVWLGTSHGLFRLRNGQFVTDPAISALGDHAARALLSGRDGTLWIGTESGLFRWRDERMLRVPVEDDGGSHAVLSILEDANGQLWLGGPDRVRRVSTAAIDAVLDAGKGEAPGSKIGADHGDGDFVAPEVFSVLKETGAALYGGMPASSATDGQAGAWYISDAGLIQISGSTPPPEEAPSIVLRRVAVDGREIAIPKNGVIPLPPSTRTLEIEAAPIVLGSHAGLRVRRELVGFDRGWSPLPGSHVATYTNLAPGSYVYRVKAGWRNGHVLSMAEVRVVQQAYFYRQWWFLALCSALVALTAWLLHRQRVHQVAVRFRAVAEERNRVAREMHDTILQGCIGISFLLDGIASSDETQTAGYGPRPRLPKRSRAALDLARTEIERTIREARIAIWNMRRTESEPHLDRSLRELFDTMTGPLPIPATFRSSGSALPVTQEQQQEIVMTVREALQNCIRHADAEKIALSLQYTRNGVAIEIADCGRGFPRTPEEPDGHFGIMGMRERMLRIGGVCRIDSAEGNGTTVTLEVPLERR